MNDHALTGNTMPETLYFYVSGSDTTGKKFQSATKTCQNREEAKKEAMIWLFLNGYDNTVKYSVFVQETSYNCVFNSAFD